MNKYRQSVQKLTNRPTGSANSNNLNEPSSLSAAKFDQPANRLVPDLQAVRLDFAGGGGSRAYQPAGEGSRERQGDARASYNFRNEQSQRASSFNEMIRRAQAQIN